MDDLVLLPFMLNGLIKFTATSSHQTTKPILLDKIKWLCLVITDQQPSLVQIAWLVETVVEHSTVDSEDRLRVEAPLGTAVVCIVCGRLRRSCRWFCSLPASDGLLVRPFARLLVLVLGAAGARLCIV